MRLLKPGGKLSVLEISAPRSRVLQWPYLFYLKYMIPFLGRKFLGNPANYRMLGIYTERFGDCAKVEKIFKEAGLAVCFRKYFFGCVTGLTGKKPM